jgi:tRNA(Ser,Leu) C12 N-acetylase TAN1
VTGQIDYSLEKDFLSKFYVSLPGYPISCQIDDTTIHGELMFKNNILVFGKYNLLFCYPDTVNRLEPGYSAVSLTRTFCEPISITGLDILEMLSSEIIDVQAAFGQPLHAQIKLDKPLNLNPWERLKNLLLRKTWVEVTIEGRITAEIARNHYNPDLELEESPSQFRGRVTAEQDDLAIQQEAVIDLEELAEQVQKIISQRQEEKTSLDLETVTEQVQKIISQRQEEKTSLDLETVTEQVQKIISQRQEEKTSLDLETVTALMQKIISQHEEEKALREREARQEVALKPDAIPPGQGEPEVLNMAKVTEVVLNILHARDAARIRQEQQYRPQSPPTIERQGFLNAPHPKAAESSPVTAREAACGWNGVGCQPAPALLPDQVPSRPGFQAVIHNPPPKPPGAGG